MKKIITEILILFTFTLSIYLFSGFTKNQLTDPSGAVTYSGTNYRIFTGPFLQIETSAYTSPGDSQKIAATAITDYLSGGYSTGFYFSSNNGLSWTGTDHIVTAVGTTIATIGDPIILFSRTNLILTFIAFPQSGNALKIGSSYSGNNGATWSPVIYIPGVDTADKPISAIDNNSASAYFGRSYVAYDEITFDQLEVKGVYFSYSTNEGVSWDSSERITNINSTFKNRLVSDVTIGNAGEVYVMWYTNRSFIGLAKSTNGGVDWIFSNDTAIPTNSGRHIWVYNQSVLLQGVPAMEIDRSGGPRNGWLYAVNREFENDSLDIMLRRSTNGGTTWSSPFKVNQDSPAGFKIQAMPAVNVDEYGGINILYYDARHSDNNDSFDVYLSRSTNGGTTFTDIKISDHSFVMSQPQSPLFGFEGYIGSYAGITSGNDKLIPVWYDNSSGKYDAWTTSIELRPAYEIKIIPEGFFDVSTQRLRMKDTVRAYIRSAVAPFNRIDSAKGVLDSVTFIAGLKFNPNLATGNYYIEVQHRNSIETWSAGQVNYSFGNKVVYDFTLSPSSAYGNNLKFVGGRWTIYSGDVNKDDIVDVSDVVNIYNAADIFLTGYIQQDITGDMIADVTDIVTAYNNGQNFVTAITP